MRLHLYTTDISGMALANALDDDDRFTAIVVPGNRSGSAKVAAVRADSPLPVAQHMPGDALPDETPAADAVVSWLYSQIIAADLLGNYPRGGLNMHGGRLPEYRGANVLNWAIANEETELGITWHEMVAEVDAGSILAESTVPIGPEDTAAEVREVMIAEGIRIFPEAFARFRDGAAPLRIPDTSMGRVWPSRRPKHGRIGPGWPAARVSAMIRAQTGPWPDASVEVDGEWVSIQSISRQGAPGLIPYRAADRSLIYLVPSDVQ